MSAFLKNRIMTDKTSLTIPLIEFFKAGGTLKNCKPITKKRYIAYPEETNNEVNKFKWRVVEELYLPNPRGMHNFRVAIEEKCGPDGKTLVGTAYNMGVLKTGLIMMIKTIACIGTVTTKV